MKNCFAVLLFFFLTLSSVSCVSTCGCKELQLAPLSGKVEVQGHRGARARRPENTLAAFKYALAVGVDTLEFDLGVTIDNVLVVHHDAHINRDLCLKSSGEKLTETIYIKDLTLKKLKSFDCGSLKNGKYPKQEPQAGEKIPTLKEVFELVLQSSEPAAKTVKFNIETKIKESHPERYPTPEKFVELLVDILKKYKMIERVTVQSFDFRTITLIKEKLPGIKTSALTDQYFLDFVKVAKESKADVISPRWGTIGCEDVKKLHERGVEVIPWTVNDEGGWETMLLFGVDGIITDDPEPLIRFLKRKGRR